MKVVRWINGIEPAPDFFPSLDQIPEEYKFIEEFRTPEKKPKFNQVGFDYVYPKEVILSLINLIEEPIMRRVLLDDYRRTYPEDEISYKQSMRALLQSQIDALSN